MISFTRRLFLQGAGGLLFPAAALGTYSCGVEAACFLQVKSYFLTPPSWPHNLAIKAVVISDIHACEPWMSAERIRSIANISNALNPDIILLLGDFNGSTNLVSGPVLPAQWGEALAVLKAPLGVYSVLGNHDWWHGVLPSRPGDSGEAVRQGLRRANIKLLENEAIRLEKDGQIFWVAGLGDQIAHLQSTGLATGVDDLAKTLAQITEDAPILLLAHEPAIIHQMPSRVSLTLSGHTHGGQINIPFIDPAFLTPHLEKGLVYGHIVHNERNLIISGGLGTTLIPARFNRPPEIVEICLGKSFTRRDSNTD
jgi:predicted MPP superfamily phosphohydrolase